MYSLRRHLGLGLVALCLSSAEFASAATIGFDRDAIDVEVGSQVAVDIVGSAFDAGSAGGGLNLSWDPAVLSIAALGDVELLFPGDVFVFDKGTLDAAAGTLTNLTTNRFFGVPDAAFTIARITFTAVGAGATSLDLALGSFPQGGSNVWTTGAGAEISNLTFETASVTALAPVPLPPAAALFAGAIALLGLRRPRDARVGARD